MTSLPNLDATKPAEKIKVFTANLALRISVHEAGHVLFALQHGRNASVRLPALENSLRSTRFDMDAQTAFSTRGLSDEALLDIVLGGFCAERAYLRMPTFSREAHRAANDCLALISRLANPFVVVPGISIPVHRRPSSSLPLIVQQNARLQYAQHRLLLGEPDEANAIVLGIMNLPIARQTLRELNARRDELINIAGRLFQTWEANKFDVTDVSITAA